MSSTQIMFTCTDAISRQYIANLWPPTKERQRNYRSQPRLSMLSSGPYRDGPHEALPVGVPPGRLRTNGSSEAPVAKALHLAAEHKTVQAVVAGMPGLHVQK